MNRFNSVPLLKIIIPYLLGIFYALRFDVLPHVNIFFLVSITLVVITFFSQTNAKKSSLLKKTIYTISIHGFLFVLAHLSISLYDAKNDPRHYSHSMGSEKQMVIASIAEVPVFTNYGLKLIVNLTCLKYRNEWKPVTGKTIIYLKKDSLPTFHVGEFINIDSKWSYINEPKNPNEFNYKQYLEHKNIYHVVYSDYKHITKNKYLGTDYSIELIGEKIKAKLVNSLRQSCLSENSFAICSALLVGFDDEIDKDVLSSFSHSGTLHILSVSGMHTGVICSIILFLFSLIDKTDRYKKTKCAVIIFVLLLFTTITGFSPSVLRASLMLSLIMLGKTFQKQSNSYNTLVLSAFILLLFNPFLIIDVGFLLSYFAVFGILYFYPILESMYYIEHKILKWFWSSCLISISATLFTLPITLYFFHQFPIWFVLSNLITIPISLLVMFLALCIVLLHSFVVIQNILSKLTNHTVDFMIQSSNLSNRKYYGYIDSISFDSTDALFLSICIALFLIIVRTKSYKLVTLTFIVCIIWALSGIVKQYSQINEQEIVVFHIKKKSFFVTRIGHHIYYDLNRITEAEFEKYIKPYTIKYSNLILHHSSHPMQQLNKKRFLNISQSNQKLNSDSVNYILVSHNSFVNLNTLKMSKPLIIGDCSNTNKTLQRLKKECAKYHLQFYNIKEQGALILSIKNEEL